MRWKQYFKLLYLINNNVYLLLIIQNNAVTRPKKTTNNFVLILANFSDIKSKQWLTHKEISCDFGIFGLYFVVQKAQKAKLANGITMEIMCLYNLYMK